MGAVWRQQLWVLLCALFALSHAVCAARTVPLGSDSSLGPAVDIPKFSDACSAHPAGGIKQVILVRHAEKPKGKAYSVNLSAAGAARAIDLAPLFMEPKGPFHTPDRMYSMAQSNASNHCYETVYYLATALGIDTPFKGENERWNNLFIRYEPEALVESILSDEQNCGKVVLICFEHMALVTIAQGFGAEHAIGWGFKPFKSNDDYNYDAMWVITPSKESNTSKFQVLSEQHYMDKVSTS